MGKTLIILRSCSGNGKSKFSEFLQNLYSQAVIVCADDYQFEDGVYKFDVKKLGFAHKSCQVKFDKALDDKVELIIVANTNTKFQDFKYYLDKGQQAGYTVHVMILEHYHKGENSHNVPEETLLRQQNNIINSMRLL